MNLKTFRQSYLFKIVLVLTVVFWGASSSWAFLYNVKVLDKQAIAALSDEALIDLYVDVLVELGAVKTFYTTSQLTPQDFRQFKERLRFKADLILEMQKRKIEIPQLEL